MLAQKYCFFATPAIYNVEMPHETKCYFTQFNDI